MHKSALDLIELEAEDYHAIGKLTVTFSALENALARATIALRGGPEVYYSDKSAEEELKQTIWATFGKRFRDFCNAYKEAGHDETWLNDFEKKMNSALSLRNMTAHGLWRKTDEGKLEVEFTPKGKAGFEVLQLPHKDWAEIAETNAANSLILDDMIGKLEADE